MTFIVPGLLIMRQLNRLNQFQRLWQPSRGATQKVTIAQLAGRCFCSERHIRTLLRQAQQAGWLNWQPQSGRGKRGTLSFQVTPEQLRNEMMEHALAEDRQNSALALAQLAPVELRTLLHPFLGGQWQNNRPTLRIPYYRPFEPLSPGVLSGRAEQHLCGQIFSGVMRFEPPHREPVGDLAHHWQIAPDGLRWHFYIRSTLYWHNGDPVRIDQLAQRLGMLLALPALQKLFASVQRVEIAHGQCLTFILTRPDYWLPYRLASCCCLLAHPQQPQLGTGPFQLKIFGPELVRLENNERYHLNHPLIQAIEYWITPQLFEQDLGTSCRHPVQIAIGGPEEVHRLRMVSSSISLGFCYLAQRKSRRLTRMQMRKIVALIYRTSLLQTLPLDEDLITPSSELLPGWEIPRPPDDMDEAFPSRLTLVYHLPVELHTMAEQLRLALAKRGCELTVIFHNAKNWEACPHLVDADLLMGDRLIGEAPEYALEQWLRCDPLWSHILTTAQHAHISSTLDAVQALPDAASRNSALQNVFHQLMSDGTLTPLFNYQYKISAPPGVNGLALNALGWFDFTKAWLPTIRDA